MKFIMRGIVAGVSLIMLASFAASSFAQTPTKTLKDEVVGHWGLVSVTINDRAPYGESPKGSMFVDGDGHYSIIVISEGDARSIAYFGTFIMNENSKFVLGHVDGVVGGSGSGPPDHDEKRVISLNGDELTVATEKDTGPGTIKMVWKRAD